MIIVYSIKQRICFVKKFLTFKSIKKFDNEMKKVAIFPKEFLFVI